MKVVGLALLVVAGSCLLPGALAADDASTAKGLAVPYPNTFFASDPSHPWNQLYGTLFIRPGWDGKLYGSNEMDPLFWPNTRYLLEEPIHHQALAVLDKFIQSDSAHLIKDPLKRALLQRMLWALFDRWSLRGSFDAPEGQQVSFDAPRRELQVRLAKIMKSVALTDDEIAALPDNYRLEVAEKAYPAAFDPNQIEQAFLPDAFFSKADWVDLDGTNYDLLAPVHVQGVSGRSSFHVLISLPTGRADTLTYLKKLHDFQPHWTYDESKRNPFADGGMMGRPWTSADIPQVPLLTKFALVRKANLIDANGDIRSSPLIESVQIRVIRTIRPYYSSGGEQSFFLFTLDQKELMAGKGGLVAEGKSDLGFDLVLESGAEDPLQKYNARNSGPASNGEFPRLSSCFACHSAAGIFSMNSYRQFFQSNRTLLPPDLREEDDADWESEVWKQKEYNWGLLQAYWYLQN